MKNAPGLPGSIVLLASASRCFGGARVVAYVASKHGVIGLLRASQLFAQQYGIRINAIAPFVTPTRIPAGFAKKWHEAGLEANRPQRVAEVIGQVAMDPTRKGFCVLVIAGDYPRELEFTMARMLAPWLGEDVARSMTSAMQFFQDVGGYVLPSYR
ncbi:uncharacterized protein BP01DRAFT_378214 [Aspergillus saccharolyticus JOP 1030-1]|uniref:NAD(P)-binding protein n=1 Tax=Aspergillus saccharolyticus JOP 1030-1 TaxID=1450539 RepID=A0A319ATT8_9EURO|nr:hypothetical protein BP01DRAFT_378214 [Aspergillus saccharolyticus JOP 1030-1]PYH49602.1 hypothetical protein BP01DRAFT_378214 [Aspergillus saccharolyticus JOP 1030-1]